MRLLNLQVRVAMQRIEILLYLHQKGRGVLLYLRPYQRELLADIISGAAGQSKRTLPMALAIVSQVFPHKSTLSRALPPHRLLILLQILGFPQVQSRMLRAPSSLVVS
jgi:hypothetical protein